VILHEKRDTRGQWLSFADIEAAKTAGWTRSKDAGPWEFEVLDDDSQAVARAGSL
jgi:hypothetical protein